METITSMKSLGALGNSGMGNDCVHNVGQDHVLVTVNNSKIGRCGGSLLSSEWVLTAAHCNATGLQVILGHSPSKEGEIRDVIAVNQYISGSKPHNILLLKIRKASDQSSRLAVKLPDSSVVTPINQNVQFYSWVVPDIDDKDGKMTPQSLKCAELSVDNCQEINYEDKQGVPEELDHADHKLLCTKAKEGCGWYSAGSLVYKGVLRGMLINYSLDCKTLQFLDIVHYREWIRNIQ